MNKGKEILVDIISSYKDKLLSLEDQSIIICDTNIVDLYNNLKADKYYLANLSDELIDEIIKQNKYKSHILFTKKLYQLKNLFIGKNDYNINIANNEENNKTIDTFLSLINNIIQESNIIDKKDIFNRLDILTNNINNNEIINDQPLIELITKEYDITNYDTNMLTIMEYVSKHNAAILENDTLTNITLTNAVNINPVSDDIKKILLKLDMDYNSLPLEYKLLINDANEDEIKEIYDLIRHNKVENYGILHFIDRHNSSAKLAILLFSSVDTIKNVVETFRDTNDEIDVNSLKKLINVILPVFISKNNSLYESLYDDYMNNIKLFKQLNINVISLLNKCPLLFIVKHDTLTSTLNYFNKYKIDKKKFINKLYKTLAYNPELITTNAEVLKKYIDLSDYLKGDNYNLLKVVNLKYKLDKLNINEDILNNLITYIYDNKERYMWGDNNA